MLQHLLEEHAFPEYSARRARRWSNLSCQYQAEAPSLCANQSAANWRAASGSSAWTCSAPPSAIVKILSVLSAEPTLANILWASSGGQEMSFSPCMMRIGCLSFGRTSAKVKLLTRSRASSIVLVPITPGSWKNGTERYFDLDAQRFCQMA